MAAPRKFPFPFILDLLSPIDIVIKSMFGCQAIYFREKIIVIVRDREDHVDANGIWMATSAEHHASLKKEFPSMHSVYILSNGKNETGWQMIHKDDDNFESAATKICELVIKGDPRIGKVPKSKKAEVSKKKQAPMKKSK